MKQKIRILLVMVIAALGLLTLTGCAGISVDTNGLILGNNYRLESGETFNSDLTIVGGNAVIEEGSTVKGDIAVLGGNVTIDGEVEGNVSVMGGNAQLEDNAHIRGNIASLGGSVRRSAGAVVEGSENNDNPLSIPAMRAPAVQVDFDPITGPLVAFFRALALAALAILVNLFAAVPMQRTGRTAVTQPIIAGGMGLLTIIVAPALLLLLGITIILLPLSLLGLLVLGIAVLFGWLALGLIVGRQLSVWLKQAWSDPVSAGVGTLVLSLLSSMLNLVPCIGWLANALIWFIALGAVILTRFGTQSYPVYAPIVPVPAPVTREEGPYAGGAQIYPSSAPEATDPNPPARPYGSDDPNL